MQSPTTNFSYTRSFGAGVGEGGGGGGGGGGGAGGGGRVGVGVGGGGGGGGGEGGIYRNTTTFREGTHWTYAPIPSEITRTGTTITPLYISGGTSSGRLSPLMITSGFPTV